MNVILHKYLLIIQSFFISFFVCVISKGYNMSQSYLTAEHWLVSSNHLKINFSIMNYICHRKTLGMCLHTVIKTSS